jgi:hypothetical protein
MLFAVALTLAAAVTPSPTTAQPSELETQAELKLASAVVNRQAQPLPEKVVAGQTVFAFTEVKGPGGGYVQHVWTCNGKEVARHYLPLGQSKRWRTWSKHKVTAGECHVTLIAQNGTELHEASIEVLPAPMDMDD